MTYHLDLNVYSAFVKQETALLIFLGIFRVILKMTSCDNFAVDSWESLFFWKNDATFPFYFLLPPVARHSLVPDYHIDLLGNSPF